VSSPQLDYIPALIPEERSQKSLCITLVTVTTTS